MSASVPAHRHAPAPSLLVRTQEISGANADLSGADLLALLPAPRVHAAGVWLRRGEGLVGWGEAARIATDGPDRFAQASAQWRTLSERLVVRDEVELPGTGPVAFGSFTFSSRSAESSALVLPRVILGCREGRAWITTVSSASDLTPPPTLGQLRAEVAPLLPPGRLHREAGALSPSDWLTQVQSVIDRIRNGDIGKVVMARDEHGTLTEPIDARRVLTDLAETYPSCWTFAVDGLVGATPELLIRRERGLVSSRVLAGTIPRSGDDRTDLATAASLARSSKDLEEHEFAVTSLTQALRPIAASTNAPEAPYVLHLPNVMHLATDVTAVLDEGHAHLSSLDLAALLHPTAAVCGTPTLAAAEAISEHEYMDRGRYAAPVGWIGADGDGEWGIALRCAQIDPSGTRARLFAGCGIVAASDPDSELSESEAKLEPMRSVLG